MKKLSIFVITAAFLITSSVVYAAKNETGAQDTGSQTGNQTGSQGTTTQGQQQVAPLASPTGVQVQNNNQVKTQNQGEDTQLKVNTQEQESQGDDQSRDTSKNEAPRSEAATENMSVVSQKVEELLTTEGAQGGIGQQVKQIAQEQKTAQQAIQTELGKVDSRKGLLKSLIGPDYKALKNVQKQMEQNQLRIQQLEQLQNQLTNQGDITMVQETIQVLTEQNTALQEQINLEEQSGSLLGWLFKLLAR